MKTHLIIYKSVSFFHPTKKNDSSDYDLGTSGFCNKNLPGIPRSFPYFVLSLLLNSLIWNSLSPSFLIANLAYTWHIETWEKLCNFSTCWVSKTLVWTLWVSRIPIWCPHPAWGIQCSFLNLFQLCNIPFEMKWPELLHLKVQLLLAGLYMLFSHTVKPCVF